MKDVYPREAFAPDGVTLWWHVDLWPGTKTKFGGEKRLAAYMYFNMQVGDTFTMDDLRIALGRDGKPEKAEHLNRRFRRLREEDWVLVSYKDANLPNNTYRLDAIGHRVWLRESNNKSGVSARTRRMVFDRDGSRCVICGIGSRESYPSEPGSSARLTVGHRIPVERGGSNDLGNLRTECSRCNEPMRHTAPDPDSLDEVWARIRDLSRSDSVLLYQWLTSGERPSRAIDLAHYAIRSLTTEDQEEMARRLGRKMR